MRHSTRQRKPSRRKGHSNPLQHSAGSHLQHMPTKTCKPLTKLQKAHNQRSAPPLPLSMPSFLTTPAPPPPSMHLHISLPLPHSSHTTRHIHPHVRFTRQIQATRQIQPHVRSAHQIHATRHIQPHVRSARQIQPRPCGGCPREPQDGCSDLPSPTHHQPPTASSRTPHRT